MRSRPIKRAKTVSKAQKIDVTRSEFDRVIDVTNEHAQMLNDLRHNQEIQLKRIAQLQAEIDQLKQR